MKPTVPLFVAMCAVLALAAPVYLTPSAASTSRQALQAAISGASRAEGLRLAAALAALGGDASGLCSRASADLSSEQTFSDAILEDIHASLRTALLAKCKVNVHAKASQTILEALEEAESLVDIHNAAGAVDALSAIAKLEGKNVPEALGAAAQKILSLKEDDGTFRGTTKDVEGTPANAALAIRAFAWLKARNGATDWNEVATAVAAAAPQLLAERAVKTDVIVAADILTALSEFATSVRALELDGDDIAAFAPFFTKLTPDSSLEEAARIEGLAVLASNAIAMPLAVEPLRTSASYAKPSKIEVRVVDALGRPVAASCKVAISGGPLKGSFAAVGNAVYAFDALASKPEPGSYELELTVTPDEQSKYVEAEADVEAEVFGTLQLGSFTLEVFAPFAAADKRETFTARYPAATATAPRNVGMDKRVAFSFGVTEATTKKAVAVDQAFVRLTAGKRERTLVAVPSKDGATLRAESAVEALVRALDGARDDIKVTVVVGDAHATPTFEWPVSSLHVAGGGAARAEKDVRAEYYAVKPDIAHIFAQPAPRPSAALSTAFTGLVLAPLLVLLVLLLVAGANLRNVPKSSGALLAALVFHCCVAAYLALLVCYFLFLDMLQTLAAIGVLALPAVVSGRCLLRALAAERETKAAKSD